MVFPGLFVLFGVAGYSFRFVEVSYTLLGAAEKRATVRIRARVFVFWGSIRIKR